MTDTGSAPLLKKPTASTLPRPARATRVSLFGPLIGYRSPPGLGSGDQVRARRSYANRYRFGVPPGCSATKSFPATNDVSLASVSPDWMLSYSMLVQLPNWYGVFWKINSLSDVRPLS